MRADTWMGHQYCMRVRHQRRFILSPCQRSTFTGRTMLGRRGFSLVSSIGSTVFELSLRGKRAGRVMLPESVSGASKLHICAQHLPSLNAYTEPHTTSTHALSFEANTNIFSWSHERFDFNAAADLSPSSSCILSRISIIILNRRHNDAPVVVLAMTA